MVDIILHNAKIAINSMPSFVEALAIEGGKICATGKNDDILRLRGPATRVIDAKGRTIIPGLNDSHMHPIRGGLNYNLELRWDGIASLGDALRMLKDQAARTPAPQWVRVVGGWTEFQFTERRMPLVPCAVSQRVWRETNCSASSRYEVACYPLPQRFLACAHGSSSCHRFLRTSVSRKGVTRVA
jgi:amidohydrolase family protein